MIPQVVIQSPLLRSIYGLAIKSKCMVSAIVYLDPKNGKSYIINKTEKCPAFKFDWQAYSLLRNLCNSMITSGPNIRVEKGVYKSQQCYGDQNVKQMYATMLKGKKQKLYALSKQMSIQQLRSQINEDYYQILNGKLQTSDKNILEILQLMIKNNHAPVILEFGMTLLHQLYQLIIPALNNAYPNPIDFIYISYYSGQIPQQCIGNQYNLPIQALYDQTWRSQEIQNNDVSKQLKGKYYIVAYQPKK